MGKKFFALSRCKNNFFCKTNQFDRERKTVKKAGFCIYKIFHPLKLLLIPYLV